MNILIQQARRGVQERKAHALRDTPTSPKAHITLTDRLRSGYHHFLYEATQALRWSRGTYREALLGTLFDLTPSQYDRIEELAAIYGTRFERRYPPETTLLNYGYLDLLDRATTDHKLEHCPQPGNLRCGKQSLCLCSSITGFFPPVTPYRN